LITAAGAWMTGEDKSHFKILIAARLAISYANFLAVVPRGTSARQSWFLQALSCRIQFEREREREREGER